MIFDEAHEIESVAGDYFGMSVSNYKLQDLRRDLSFAVGRMKKFGHAQSSTVSLSGWKS